jgi:hypothetical protein
MSHHPPVKVSKQVCEGHESFVYFVYSDVSQFSVNQKFLGFLLSSSFIVSFIRLQWLFSDPYFFISSIYLCTGGYIMIFTYVLTVYVS